MVPPVLFPEGFFMNTRADSKSVAKAAVGKVRMTPSEAFVETLVAQGHSVLACVDQEGKVQRITQEILHGPAV